MKRSEQKKGDTWDIGSLFPDEGDFESAIAEARATSEKIAGFKGKLRMTETILDALMLDDVLGILMEKIGSYAYMKLSEDGTSSVGRGLYSAYVDLESAVSEQLSFFTPELLSLDGDFLDGLCANAEFSDYSVMLRRMVREKKHVLGEREERIMALQRPVGSMFSSGFDDLADVDFKFGKIGGVELTNSTYVSFLRDDDRKVRRSAYFRLYGRYHEYRHLLARLYEGNVRQHVFVAKARGYASVIESRLYGDDIPVSVYENLISAAHSGFPLLHRYYDLKKRARSLKTISHYDVYLPFSNGVRKNIGYDEAARTVRDAVMPLGEDYANALYDGITAARWVDRYENEGKASGAYSNGGFEVPPFIMMNYRGDSYRDVFTLAHEGGHSMHSRYSAANNPFSCYGYSIFEAETASTFNERLLSHHLLSNVSDKGERLYLLSQEADDIVATFFRQTMFAEYERDVFAKADAGETLGLEAFTGIYAELLGSYFGKGVRLFEKSSLEAFRIPHFYRPFYVYKYATGMTAAIMLSERVLSGERGARDGYLEFLKSGGSLFPLENLRRAGADLSDPKAFGVILARFGKILDEIEGML